MEKPDELANLAPVSDEETERFLNWLFGPGGIDDMQQTHETQCSLCGRRHWRVPGKEDEACPTCGGICSATGRFQDPDLVISKTMTKGDHSYSRSINPQEEHRVFLPVGIFG